jgi:hypothetical protein
MLRESEDVLAGDGGWESIGEAAGDDAAREGGRISR